MHKNDKDIEAMLLRNSLILDLVPDIIMEVDNNKIYRWANDAGYSFFGDDVIGKEAAFYFEGKQETYKIVDPLFKGNEDIHYVESWQRRKDGEKRLLAWKCKVFKSPDGKVSGALSTARDITEQWLANMMVRESENIYRELINGMVDTVWVIDFNGNLLDVNNSAIDLMGYSKDELLKTGIFGIDSSFKKETIKEMAKSMPADKIQVFETTHKAKNGKIIPVEVSSTLINYKGQKSILSIARDISKRKNAEEEVVHERLLLRTLIDNLPDAIYVKDKNARKIIANKADMLLMNCKSENDFLGKTDIEIYHNNEKGIHGYDEDILVISTGKPLLNHENHYIDSNGCDRWRIINKIPLFDEQKQVIGLVGIGKDITERKKAEEALYVSEEKYRTLFNQSFLGIYLHDLNGNIIDINQMACMQSGFSRDELLKMSVFENMPAIDENFDIAKDSIIKEWKQWKIGQRTTLQAEHRRKDGSVYPVEISTGLIRYRDKNILLAIVQDITKRKEAENELIRLKEKAEESDRLKTAFLHNISHEIRTPMNAIVGFSELLKNPELPVNKRNVFSELISNSSKQLLTIINDIVNIATVEAGQEKIHEKQVNINSLFHLLYEQLIISAQKKSLVLNYKTALPDEDAIILTDEIKLLQVISNLVSNAIKYTKKGNIEFGYVLKDAKLEFYVKDTGFGIPQNKQNDIFIRFHQIEPDDKEYYGGSGLGLAISKAYVELLGGNIWLNSQVGAGSVFYFTIPYKKTENINHDVSKIQNELNKTQKKITLLVTEDDNTNFMLLQEVFSSPKFLIIRALNGFESVEICKKNKLIDLVIMDIKMPLMDGYEATSEIKKVCPRLPVIALTAYSTDVDKEKAIKSGCCDFVSKPFKHNELIAKIEKYI